MSQLYELSKRGILCSSLKWGYSRKLFVPARERTKRQENCILSYHPEMHVDNKHGVHDKSIKTSLSMATQIYYLIDSNELEYELIVRASALWSAIQLFSWPKVNFLHSLILFFLLESDSWYCKPKTEQKDHFGAEIVWRIRNQNCVRRFIAFTSTVWPPAEKNTCKGRVNMENKGDGW